MGCLQPDGPPRRKLKNHNSGTIEYSNESQKEKERERQRLKEWNQMDINNINKSQVPFVKDTFKMLYNRQGGRGNNAAPEEKSESDNNSEARLEKLQRA